MIYMVEVPQELLYRMSRMVDSCRDLAFQLRKEYIYNECVKLQKEISQLYQEINASIPELDLEE